MAKIEQNFKCVRKPLSTTVHSFLKGFPIENTRLCLEGKRTSCLQYLHGFTTNNALERNIFKCELVELKVVNVLSPKRCFVCNDLATLCPYMMQHYGPGQSFVIFFFFFSFFHHSWCNKSCEIERDNRKEGSTFAVCFFTRGFTSNAAAAAAVMQRIAAQTDSIPPDVGAVLLPITLAYSHTKSCNCYKIGKLKATQNKKKEEKKKRKKRARENRPSRCCLALIRGGGLRRLAGRQAGSLAAFWTCDKQLSAVLQACCSWATRTT